jgi:hydrogenase expression/formation protein HypD
MLPKHRTRAWTRLPGCVLPMGRVDDCVAIAERPEVIFATFGDAMRVPGSRMSLLQAKAEGADVRMVYSPSTRCPRARNHARVSSSASVWTIPSTALTGLQAEREGSNFDLLQSHHHRSDNQGRSRRRIYARRFRPGHVSW